jgi:hypothetical protein
VDVFPSAHGLGGVKIGGGDVLSSGQMVFEGGTLVICCRVRMNGRTEENVSARAAV